MTISLGTGSQLPYAAAAGPHQVDPRTSSRDGVEVGCEDDQATVGRVSGRLGAGVAGKHSLGTASSRSMGEQPPGRTTFEESQTLIGDLPIRAWKSRLSGRNDEDKDQRD